MPYETYKIIHLIGLASLFLGLGGILAGGKRPFAILHGIGLVLLLVAGFGIQARLALGFPAWMLAKIGIWIVLALVPVAVKRKQLPAFIAAVAALALGAVSAWLAVAKPF